MAAITATQEEFEAVQEQSQANNDAINAEDTGILARLEKLEAATAKLPATTHSVDTSGTFKAEAATLTPAAGGAPAYHFRTGSGPYRYFLFNSKKVVFPNNEVVTALAAQGSDYATKCGALVTAGSGQITEVFAS